MSESTIPIVPERNLLLGHLRQFRADNLQWLRTAAGHGELVRWYFGPFPVFQVNHPELIREVLATKAESFHKTRQQKRILSEVIGRGILVSDGEFWQQQHKLIQPALHAQRIQSYAEIMTEHTRRLLDTWEHAQEVEIRDQMSALTLGIVAKALFDADVHDVAYQVAEIVAVGQASINRRFNRFFDPPRWLPVSENRRRASPHLRRLEAAALPAGGAGRVDAAVPSGLGDQPGRRAAGGDRRPHAAGRPGDIHLALLAAP